MAIVRDQSCCIFKLNIPNGVFTIEQKFGVDAGIMKPGFRCCYTRACGCNKIMCMISKNSIRYKCSITNVPTKDNVRIGVDVGINFHISRLDTASEAEDVRKFFYNFGPNRLEELL